MNRLKRSIVFVYILIYGIIHPIKRQVLFNSFNGKQYSDNPRAISETLHKMHPEITIAWYFRSLPDVELPEYINVVLPSTYGRFSFLKALIQSFCYVTNFALEPNIIKKRGQFFVQTNHGDIALKKVLYDAWDQGKRPERVMDEVYTDLAVAGSKFGEEQYRTAFHYYGEVITCGMARDDCLIHRDSIRIAQVKKNLKIQGDVKVLLYAPTFRDGSNKKQRANVDLEKTIKSLQKNGEEWICLIRAHSASKGIDFQCDGKRFIQVSNYPDMAELLMISDMLITDYSSCAGDFLLTGKPTILAIFDQEEYVSQCRSLPFDFKEAGFFVANNQDELEKIIANNNAKDYYANCNKLINHFQMNTEGNGAEIVCKRIAFYAQQRGLL